MCYSVYLSTDSSADLTARNSPLLRFTRASDVTPNCCIDLLEYPEKWFVGSKSECSCTFRHLHSIELGFGAPVDWFPEEADSIDATGELYDTLSWLLSSGSHVDLLDQWAGADCERIATLEISLGGVSRQAFRMFENHVFRFSARKEQRQHDDLGQAR